MKTTTIIACAALVACQNTTFNGVKMSQERATWGLALAGIAAAVFYLEQNQDKSNKPACKTYAPVFDLKGGETFCAIPLD